MNANRSDTWQIQTSFQTTAVYTPSIIAKFMVNQIRHHIETWEGDLRDLKILEPSCGPGAFLVILYHILREEYSKRRAPSTSDLLDAEPQAQEYSPQDDPLRYNLYGVDINLDAVALAKLNLSKQRNVLDPNSEVSEQDEPARRSSVSVDVDELSMSQDQIPHLKVGDFLFDDSENVPFPFNWAKEFPEVFHRNPPGFDIIIGNPPYSVDRNLPPAYRKAIENRYGEYYRRQLDLYIPFVPRALELVRKNGLICYIIQHSLLAAKVTLPLREYLLENSKIHLIVDFGRFRRKVFDQSKVQVLPTIILFERSPPPEDWQVHCVLTTQDPIAEGGLYEGLKESYLPQQYYQSKPLKPILTSDIRSIEEKINANCIELGRIYDVSYGLSLRPLRHLLYNQKVKDWEDYCFLHTRGDFIRPFSDRRPFTSQYYLLLEIGQYTAAIGKAVRKGQGGAKLEHFIHPHLLIRRVCMDRVEATYFAGDPIVVANDSVLVATPRHLLDAKTNKKGVKQRKQLVAETNKSIKGPKMPFEEYSPHFILALINSAPIRWLYQQTMSVDLAIYPRFIKQFPIPNPRTESSREVEQKARKIMELNRQKDEFLRVFDGALIKKGFVTEEFYWTGSKSMSKNTRRWRYTETFRAFSTATGSLTEAGMAIFENLKINYENISSTPPIIARKGRNIEVGTRTPLDNTFLVSHRFKAKSLELAIFAYLLFVKQRRSASSQANWSFLEKYFILPRSKFTKKQVDQSAPIIQKEIKELIEEIWPYIPHGTLEKALDFSLIDEEIEKLTSEIDELVLDLWGIEDKNDRQRILTEEFGS